MKSPDVLRAALELYRNRQLPGVVAVCRDALEYEPDHNDLRVLLARALIGLRQDDQARNVLRASLATNGRCAITYRLLGELELRRDDFRSAEIFFKEALRLDPDDLDSADYLLVSLSLNQPTAAVEKLPAAAAAVGCPSPAPGQHRRFALGTNDDGDLGERAPTPAASGGQRPAAPTTTDHFDDPCEEIWQENTPLGAGHAHFGAYLVAVGVLTATELQAALTYHHATGLRLGAAAVALGLVSEPRLEWAALAFHSQRRAAAAR